MPGVRKFNDDPARWCVTFTHAATLDDSQMRIVEQVTPYAGYDYMVCMYHKDTTCECVSAVLESLGDWTR